MCIRGFPIGCRSVSKKDPRSMALSSLERTRRKRWRLSLRALAAETEETVEALRRMEGDANSAPFPPYVRAYPLAETRCHGARCRGAARQHRGYDPQTLWRLGSRTAGELDEDPQGSLRTQAQAEAGTHQRWSHLITIQQSRVYSLRCRLCHTLNHMRLLPSHSDLDDFRIVLNKFSHSLAAE